MNILKIAIQLVFTFTVGIIAGFFTHSYLLGGGLAAISRVVVFNEYNMVGLTLRDLWFWMYTFIGGAAGAAIGRYFGIQQTVIQTVEHTTGLKSVLSQE